MSRVKVFIAGPLSGDSPVVVGNVHDATEVAAKLIKRGYTVICPHLSSFLWYHESDDPEIMPRDEVCDISHAAWIEHNKPLIEACDVVLRLPGKSPGSDLECAHAEEHGIPVVHDIDDLPDPKGVDGDEVFTTQVGGDHYRSMAVQPIDFILSNGINFAEGNVVKYVSRWREKGGVEDLRKARHYLDLLIAHEGE